MAVLEQKNLLRCVHRYEPWPDGYQHDTIENRAKSELCGCFAASEEHFVECFLARFVSSSLFKKQRMSMAHESWHKYIQRKTDKELLALNFHYPKRMKSHHNWGHANLIKSNAVISCSSLSLAEEKVPWAFVIVVIFLSSGLANHLKKAQKSWDIN